MRFLPLLLSILLYVHPIDALDNYEYRDGSSISTSLVLTQIKELLVKSKEQRQDCEEPLLGYIEEVEARIRENNQKLEKGARGATLGDFEMVCKVNAALFCNSDDVLPSPSTPSFNPTEATTDSTTDPTTDFTTAVPSSTPTASTWQPWAPTDGRPRCLKFTTAEDYLRLHTTREDPGRNTVDLVKYCRSHELWTIEERNGSITLRGHTGQYLSYKFLEGLGLVLVDELDQSTMWTPVENKPGTWSLQASDGSYLSSHRLDKVVCTMPHNMDREHFMVDTEASEAALLKTTTRFPTTQTTTDSTTTTTTTNTPATTTTTITTTTTSELTTTAAQTEDAAALLAATGKKPRCLQFVTNYFLRSWGPSNRPPTLIDFAGHCRRNEAWTFKRVRRQNGTRREDKVVIVGYADSYIRAYDNGTIADVPRLNNFVTNKDLWAPVKNDDGTWSLQSHFGQYLSSDCNDNLGCTQPHNQDREHFTIV